MSNQNDILIEEGIRESQDELWNELSTNEREDMLERAGFTMKRKGGEVEWLDSHNKTVQHLKKASEEAVKMISRAFKK